MGKINNKSSVEIIPLNQTTNRDNYAPTPTLTNMDRLPYISDPTIVPRVQKYLESNVDKTYVDINVMADDLQRSYKEYARRKRSAFRNSIKKAYSIVLQSYGLEEQDNTSSDDEEISDESAEEGTTFQNNPLNSQLLNMYSRPQVPKKIDENVLIDISSDGSDADVPASNSEKASNGPSTSQARESRALLSVPSHLPRKIVDQKNDKNPPQSYDRGRKRKSDTANLTPFPNLAKKKKSLPVLQEPCVTFKNVGGLDGVLEDICNLLIHIKHPEVYKHIGITPPRGFLLHGPPGSGKTLLANAISGELCIPMLKVAAPELVAGVSGESEERIRDLFEKAMSSTPCVLFIDEIDAITPNRQNAQKEMERRIVAQLLTCLDDLSQSESGNKVLMIGATNRPDSIDPALRRAGRFDREICLGIPGEQSRTQILKVLTSKLRLTDDFDYESLAKLTPGYVGADLLSLAREAAMAAVKRFFEIHKEQRKLAEALLAQKRAKEKHAKETAKEDDSDKDDQHIVVDDDVSKTNEVASDRSDGAIVVIDDDIKQPNELSSLETPNSEEVKVDTDIELMRVDPVKSTTPLEDVISWLHDSVFLSNEQMASLFITMDDFTNALKRVQPSAKREGFATVPDVTWEDVGSLSNIREELQMAILAPVRHSEQFKRLGLDTPMGVLLCGPPGCGKTLLAKAIANEAGINFISVKGPELLNMYVGESEKAIRVCFERARNSAPCVIFFDEFDAICPKRSDNREGGVTMRVVNQMLTEMDGVQERQGVFLLAASNRPDIIDPAVLRPGRLDKILFVGLPTQAERVDILRAITKNGTQPPLSSDVDLEVIGSFDECRGYTGADLAALVREASTIALKEHMLCGDINIPQPVLVNIEHFRKAVTKIRPSVPEKDQKHYEKLRKMYAVVPENDVEEMEYS